MDTGEIQKEKKREKCYEQLYDRKFNNLEEMNNFLETYILPKLNQEIDQLNRPITRHEIEYVIKTPPIKKSLGLDGFTGKFYQTYKEEFISNLLNIFKSLKRTNTSKVILWSHHYPNTKPDKDTT